LPSPTAVHDHQRLTGAELHDVAGGEELRLAQPPESIDLDRAAFVLKLVRQTIFSDARWPTAMMTWSTANFAEGASRST